MANNVCARLGSAQPFYTLALSLNRVLQGKVPVFTYPICFDASPPTIALSDVRSVQTTSTQDGAADRLTRFNTTLLLEVSDDNGATEDGSYCAEQAQFTLYCTGCGESFEPIVDIGTGAHTFVLADLSAGVHDITLHVEDSALNQSPPLEVRWVAGSAYAAVGLRSNVVSPDDGTVTLLSVHGLNQLPACSNATCTPGKSRGATSVTVQRDQNDAKAEAEAEACVTHSNIGHVKLFEVTVGDELLQDIAGLVDVSLLPLEITLGPTLVEFGYLDVAINNACSLHLQHSTGITSVALRVLVLESPFDKSSALDSCCGNGVSTPPACPMCVPSADNSSLKFTPLTKAQLQHPSTLVEATGSACQRVVECLHANVEQQPVTATSQWATFNSGDSAAPFIASAFRSLLNNFTSQQRFARIELRPAAFLFKPLAAAQSPVSSWTVVLTSSIDGTSTGLSSADDCDAGWKLAHIITLVVLALLLVSLCVVAIKHRRMLRDGWRFKQIRADLVRSEVFRRSSSALHDLHETIPEESRAGSRAPSSPSLSSISRASSDRSVIHLSFEDTIAEGVARAPPSTSSIGGSSLVDEQPALDDVQQGKRYSFGEALGFGDADANAHADANGVDIHTGPYVVDSEPASEGESLQLDASLTSLGSAVFRAARKQLDAYHARVSVDSSANNGEAEGGDEHVSTVSPALSDASRGSSRLFSFGRSASQSSAFRLVSPQRIATQTSEDGSGNEGSPIKLSTSATRALTPVQSPPTLSPISVASPKQNEPPVTSPVPLMVTRARPPVQRIESTKSPPSDTSPRAAQDGAPAFALTSSALRRIQSKSKNTAVQLQQQPQTISGTTHEPKRSADAHDQQSDASAGTRGLPDQALGFILKQPALSVSASQSTSPHMVAPPSPAISNRSGIVHRPVALTPASSSPSHLSVSLTSPAPNTPPTPKLVQPAKVQAANTAASQHVPSDDYTSSSESESDGDVEFL
eukprot:m.320603 g.320603  ORF g.320603 m.320603 type:complete len:979 (+) comp15994_c0_seq17:5111-8047(+)